MRQADLRSKLEELNLATGMTHRGECPICKRYNTFTARNDNGTILYNCYANSCSIHGAVGIGLSVDDIRALIAKRLSNSSNDALNRKPFVLPEYVVYDDEETALYAGQYRLDYKHLDLRFDVSERRVVFPIKHDGVLVDAIGRSLIGQDPKWRRYGEARTAYVTGQHPTALVVEDAVSAAVAETLGYTGFALLGTSLLEEHASLLRDYDKVIVALDPDAGRKTLEITRDLKSRGIKALAFYLRDDLKYRNEEDVLLLTNILKADNGTSIT